MSNPGGGVENDMIKHVAPRRRIHNAGIGGLLTESTSEITVIVLVFLGFFPTLVLPSLLVFHG